MASVIHDCMPRNTNDVSPFCYEDMGRFTVQKNQIRHLLLTIACHKTKNDVSPLRYEDKGRFTVHKNQIQCLLFMITCKK
jgi:hypothetical protein